MKENRLSRRTFLSRTSLAAAGTVAAALGRSAEGAVDMSKVEQIVQKGRINQSVSKWCYGKFSLDELCVLSRKMGIKAIDLRGPDDFPTVKKHGLVCSMENTPGLASGLNRKENHEDCLAKIREAIDAAAE